MTTLCRRTGRVRVHIMARPCVIVSLSIAITTFLYAYMKMTGYGHTATPHHRTDNATAHTSQHNDAMKRKKPKTK